MNTSSSKYSRKGSPESEASHGYAAAVSHPENEEPEFTLAQVLERRGAWARVYIPALTDTRWVNLTNGCMLEVLPGTEGGSNGGTAAADPAPQGAPRPLAQRED